MIRRLTRVLLPVLSVGIVCGCSSSAYVRAGAPPSTTVAPPAATSTTVGSLEVTVPDCGAGAYRPSTLLIACTNGGTMATGIHWTSWSEAGADGTGTVHLDVSGVQRSSMADLRLSAVNDTSGRGPQFRELTVTWIGPSPDGRSSDTFQLGNG